MRVQPEAQTAAALARMSAWWEGADLDRPAMYLVAPREGASVTWPEPPATLQARWTDVPYLLATYEAQVASTAYFAEAMPFVYINQGPVCQAGFLGCPRVFMPTTIWHEPIIENWDDFEPCFDPNNRWWQLYLEIASAAAELGAGRWCVSLPDAGAVGDIIAYMRGSERLLVDLVENPEPVWRLRDWLVPVVEQMAAEVAALTTRYFPGTMGWLALWAPGLTSAMQEDLSCMISPALFREFCLPEIQALSYWLEYPMYHLDGPAALRHLDALLEVESLRGIQWVPGAGQPGALDPVWWPLLHRILDAGKIAYCNCAPEEILPALGELPYQRLYLDCAARSEAEARELLRVVEKACA